jgi:hypothetical protein
MGEAPAARAASTGPLGGSLGLSFFLSSTGPGTGVACVSDQDVHTLLREQGRHDVARVLTLSLRARMVVQVWACINHITSLLSTKVCRARPVLAPHRSQARPPPRALLGLSRRPLPAVRVKSRWGRAGTLCPHASCTFGLHTARSLACLLAHLLACLPATPASLCRAVLRNTRTQHPIRCPFVFAVTPPPPNSVPQAAMTSASQQQGRRKSARPDASSMTELKGVTDEWKLSLLEAMVTDVYLTCGQLKAIVSAGAGWAGLMGMCGR